MPTRSLPYPAVWLIRHGQTDANADGMLQGHLPTSLNERGRHQAGRLAERLRRLPRRFEGLVSSDLPRATETAEPIARALGLRPVLEPAWRERSFGSLEGQTIGEIEIWRAASGGLDPPGAEPVAAFRQRVAEALLALAHAYRGRHAVAVVTHGGPMRMVLALLATGHLTLASGCDEPPVVPIANASILQLDAESDQAGGPVWRVVAVNDVAHLGGVVTATDAG